MSAKDVCIALFSMILLSLNIVSSKIGLEHFPPLLFTALRFISVVPFLYFFPLKGVSLKNLLLISLYWGIIYFSGVNLALSSGVSAGISIIIIQSSVFLTYCLSAILFKKWPTALQIIGTAIGFLGICIICLTTRQMANPLGLAFLVIASISFSVGMIYIKKTTCDPFALNIWISLLSAFPMFILSWIFENHPFDSLMSADFLHWSTVLFAGWISMLLAGAGWAYIVKKYDLNTVASFRLLVPIFGVGFAALFLKEYYPLFVWLGVGIVITGLIIAQWSSVYRLLATWNERRKMR